MSSDGVRNLDKALAAINGHWQPHRLTSVNDYDVKIAKVEGEFVWHTHPATDELFLVVTGELVIQLRDGDVTLGPGDTYVVPRGVEHCPKAEVETSIVMVEPQGTVNTGDAAGERPARCGSSPAKLPRMLQPGARSRIVLSVIWLLLGANMIAVPAWLGWTRGAVLVSGHPALLLVAIVCGAVGIVAVLWAAGSLVIGGRLDREVDAGLPRRRTPIQMRRRARNRIILAVPALLLAVALVGAVAYARPLAATPVALAAMVPDDRVRVDDRITWYEMSPIRKDATGNAIVPTTGLVFVAGARVDPRAYAHLLRPLAEAGYFVAVVKPPLGFSILNPGDPRSVLDVHTEIRYWALAGHSLGGTTAAITADADAEIDGLVLFASYPAARLTRTDLKVTSIFGSEDGLIPLARIEQSKADLPTAASYVEVPGAAHSWFGDYGEQPGDNRGSGDRVAAQGAITGATKALLASLPPPPKKK